nr:capsid protein [Mute swan feces associated noda-like virus 4]
MVKNRARKPKVVNAPVARASAPGRTSRYPPVPFTGTERLVSVAPTAADGASFIRTFDWNPGLASTFSAGHYQAQNFDKYTMTGRNAIRYTPSCSTLTSGSVYILIDYDPNDSAPTTENEFADNELTKTCAMYSSMTAPIDLSQLDNCKMLVRMGPSPTDKLLTDPCAIHIGAFGYGSSAVDEGLVLGHLHIDYSAKLHVRQPIPSGSAQPRNVLMLAFPSAEVPAGDTIMAPLLTPLFNSVGASYTGGAIQLPPGAYEITTRLGVTIPSQPGVHYLQMKLFINNVEVPGSQSDFNETPATVRHLELSSTCFAVIQQGDILTLQTNHDHTSTVRVSNSRSSLIARLV